jgi:hypothetical protein
MIKTEFRPLPLSSLGSATGFQQPYYFSANPVKVSSSALDVMTDLNFMPAATIGDSVNVIDAEQVMIARGVRMLLVVNALQHVVGLVTARDVQGDRGAPASTAGNVASPLPVSAVMTPADAVEVLNFDVVLHARVGDIIETLKGSGRQHALVVDRDVPTALQKVRGVFSVSQIARQLGVAPVVNFDLAGTFAELERHLHPPA